MQYASLAREIPLKTIPQQKQVRVRKVIVRKSISRYLIPYLQVIGFIIFVCLANGIVESM